MKRLIRYMGVSFLTLAALVVFAGGAYAAEPDFEDPAAVEIFIREMEASGDPYAAYAELSSEGKAAVNEYLSVATTETTGTFEPHSSDTYADSASSGCGTDSYSVTDHFASSLSYPAKSSGLTTSGVHTVEVYNAD